MSVRALLLLLVLTSAVVVAEDSGPPCGGGGGGGSGHVGEVFIERNSSACIVPVTQRAWQDGGIPATRDELASATLDSRRKFTAEIVRVACVESAKSIDRAYAMIIEAFTHNHSTMAHPMPIADCALDTLRKGLPEMYHIYTETKEQLLAAINVAEVSPPWTEPMARNPQPSEFSYARHTPMRYVTMKHAIRGVYGYTLDLDIPVTYFTVYWGYDDEETFLRRRMDHWKRHSNRNIYRVWSRRVPSGIWPFTTMVDPEQPPHPRDIV